MSFYNTKNPKLINKKLYKKFLIKEIKFKNKSIFNKIKKFLYIFCKSNYKLIIIFLILIIILGMRYKIVQDKKKAYLLKLNQTYKKQQQLNKLKIYNEYLKNKNINNALKNNINEELNKNNKPQQQIVQEYLPYNSVGNLSWSYL